ncbi:Diguanylate cyclase, GGDEF domain [uncultured archaeon]|nr:Diguanylate cyclase, GGDEF domain [uncultured archaeon]
MPDEDVLKKLVYTSRELRIIKIIQEISSSTENIDVTLNKIAKILIGEFNTHYVFIFLKDQEGLRARNFEGVYSLEPGFYDLVQTIANDTVLSASPLLIEETRYGTVASLFGIKSFISAPLMTYTGCIGCIVVMNRDYNFSYSSSKLLGTIANQTASLVDHLKLKQAVSLKEQTITQLYNKLYDKEAKKAVTDALTGLFNKRYFTELINSEYEKGNKIFLVMLDLDFFKSYNDTYGHVEGDNLLRNLGQLISTEFRKVRACRYGGEEFAFILENSLEEAITTAETFRQAVETFYPEKAKRQVTVSLGVGEIKQEENVESFIKRVDSALYKAKESGRNRVMLAE